MSDVSTASEDERDHPVKRRRLEKDESETESETEFEPDKRHEPTPCDLGSSNQPSWRPISPPIRLTYATISDTQTGHQDEPVTTVDDYASLNGAPAFKLSPIQLIKIRDLPETMNQDTTSLNDLLGDPLIKECWNFNFLFDVNFVMSHFDPDIRNTVKVRIVHGFWKRDDPRRLELEQAVQLWANVDHVSAYMPEAFGTHHSKMLILFKHDDTAQVIIHTANMISRDWTNMSQAVWRSPSLGILKADVKSEPTTLGSGGRFKTDLLRYLKFYGNRLPGLVDELQRYDFSCIRAALVASVPSKAHETSSASTKFTAWGWPGLRHILSNLPPRPVTKTSARINVQVSSIGTLTDKWLDFFFQVLSIHQGIGSWSSVPGRQNIFSRPTPVSATPKPEIKVIFPTADEIRRSLDGYESGASIHMKHDSVAQAKQLRYMKPFFCLWAGDGILPPRRDETQDRIPIREAGRRRAAPHVKTYIRFEDEKCTSVDWAMVTSANLSTQAWGALPNKDGDVRICSYEIGVVVWPELFAEEGSQAIMVPTFKMDLATAADLERVPESSNKSKQITVTGFRMPYDLPLVPYGDGDIPWCAAASHDTPDWKGQVWEGYKPRTWREIADRTVHASCSLLDPVKSTGFGYHSPCKR